MPSKTLIAIAVAVAAVGAYLARAPKYIGGKVYSPSWLTITLFTSDLSDYDHTVFENTYGGKLKVLVIGTERANLTMANGNDFFTGNHPVELLTPLLHMKAAGFDFEFATPTGKSVVLEHWAMPTKDTAVMGLYKQLKGQLDKPHKITDMPESFEGFAAIFIPGGHGAMLDLPQSAHLGKLLRAAHELSLPTFTLCHGPGVLLAAAVGHDGPFVYDGYKMTVFPDGVDKITPYLGYLPGQMPWFVGELLTAKGVDIVNTDVSGATQIDRELITGDSPQAANAVGKLYAAALLDKYM